MIFQLNYLSHLINGLLNHIECKHKETYSLTLKHIVLLYPDFIRDVSDFEIDFDSFIKETASINEKCTNRKLLGKYYTPRDVCKFMIENILNSTTKKNSELKIIDPTCGNSEFLLEFVDFIFKTNKKNICELIKNIYGNDINPCAIIISKIRIYCLILSYNIGTEYDLDNVVRLLNNNFTIKDALLLPDVNNCKYDIVIGNPPYVERKESNYGNLYADILEKSKDLLNDNGLLAFIIPISYISTIRMRSIRNLIKSNSIWQKLYNFSDRPASIFSSVHQKLSILLFKKSYECNQDGIIYSSSYNYWYKTERETLFNNISLINVEQNDKCIPKLGTNFEKKIFNKLLSNSKNDSLYEILKKKGGEVLPIYLNMRATFWIKVFYDYSRSNEYKCFWVDKKIHPKIYCFLNSSLFFWFWVVVSDGWHITIKDLEMIKFIPDFDNKWNELAKKLSSKLEKTKVFVNTKQIDYIYQHKECKNEIDEIDTLLGEYYHLTLKEVDFIKNFALKYRMSMGK